MPHLGWNRVTPVACDLLEEGYAYFANGYRLTEQPDADSGWSCATTDYGGTFVSALERDCVLACQFHPEISGSYGEQLLTRWLQRCAEVTPC